MGGRCDCVFPEAGSPQLCTYDECTSDSDCQGGLCSCAALGNVCIPALCHVDSDCGDGGFCSPGPKVVCTGAIIYACHSAGDTCFNDSDCLPGAPPPGPYAYCSTSPPTCMYDPTLGHWACANGSPECCPDGGSL
jgi:hypothetical protein